MVKPDVWIKRMGEGMISPFHPEKVKQGISFVLPQKKYPKEKGPTTALVALPLGQNTHSVDHLR